jgi:hypothetical protein
MKCLNDARIQAVADKEASADEMRHAASCERCAGLVRDRSARTAVIVSAMNAVTLPPEVGRRVTQAMTRGAAGGATRLRNTGRSSRSWRPAIWSAGAVAAATLVVVMVVLPMFKGPTTVTASEVLARSAGRLAQQQTTGVELLEYELALDGMPRDMLPDHMDGAYRVKQIIDHDTPGRYHLATYAPDGSLLSAVAQDPVNHRRVMSLKVEGQVFRFVVTLPENMTMSLPEMERLHMEASVRMMQASGDQQLQIVGQGSDMQYLIQVPRISAQIQNDVWDLTEARVLVDAADYHVVEFAVKGTFLKQPYSVSYRLIARALAAQADVQPDEFEVPADANAIRIDGTGSAIPVRDALVLALRELARTRQAGK